MTNTRNIFSLLVILLIAFLSYFNALSGSFHFDDYSSIIHSSSFKYYNEHFSTALVLKNLQNRSIVYSTFHLNHSLGGIDAFGFHVFNLAVHILTCFLIFFLFKEILLASSHIEKIEGHKNRLTIPLTASLLFAIHPLNTQAVTYITGRTTSMAVFFYIASFLFFIKGLRQNLSVRIFFFILSVIFFIGGYGSKMIVITAPIMFFVFYLFFIFQNSLLLKTNIIKRLFHHRFTRITLKFLLLSSPFILMLLSKYFNSIRYLYTTFKDPDPSSPEHYLLVDQHWFYPNLPGMVSQKLFHIFQGSKGLFDSSTYLLTEFKVLVFYYFKMLFFPFNQNIDPDFPLAGSLWDPAVLFSLSIIILCLIAGIYFYKKNRLIAFGIFWFFIVLLPTSTLLPLKDVAVEHRLYLASIGLFLVVSIFLNLFVSQYRKNPLTQSTFFTLFVLFPIIAFSSLTINRNFVWKNERTLWSDAAEKSPRFSRPLNNLAEAYDKEGLASKDKENFDRAIELLNKAISISPAAYKPYNNLGKIHGRLGRHDLAIKNLKLALKYNAKYAKAYYNLGKVYDLKGMLDEAIKEYSIAFEQDENFFEACFNLANAYYQKGLYRESLETYLKCKKLNPRFPKIYFAIGNVFAKSGDFDKAFENYSQAIKLDKDFHLANIGLANIYVMRNNISKAVELYEKVIAVSPKNYNAYNNLGLLYLQHLKKPSQAAGYFKKSLEINPAQLQAALLREFIKNIDAGKQRKSPAVP